MPASSREASWSPSAAAEHVDHSAELLLVDGVGHHAEALQQAHELRLGGSTANPAPERHRILLSEVERVRQGARKALRHGSVQRAAEGPVQEHQHRRQ
jgi:hypothetical protein